MTLVSCSVCLKILTDFFSFFSLFFVFGLLWFLCQKNVGAALAVQFTSDVSVAMNSHSELSSMGKYSISFPSFRALDLDIMLEYSKVALFQTKHSTTSQETSPHSPVFFTREKRESERAGSPHNQHSPGKKPADENLLSVCCRSHALLCSLSRTHL